MSEIISVPFDREPENIKSKVVSYWSRRAGSFAENKHDEAHSYKAGLWVSELTEQLRQLPAGQNIRILDVGCGAGFFELILAPLGYNITGIDLTLEMIEKGRVLLANHRASNAELLVMDAEKPEFPDEFFDAVITRNLTWTLPHPEDAYREWYRVLKKGGMLLNYDAEYAKGFHKYDQSENCAHQYLDDDLINECHDIYHMLSVSSLDRPGWDRVVLAKIGYRDIDIDPAAGDRLYGEKDRFYMPDRMFRIRAVK